MINDAHQSGVFEIASLIILLHIVDTPVVYPGCEDLSLGFEVGLDFVPAELTDVVM